MKPLLLHACCAPCSLEPVRLLREEGFEPTICWTNPNIQPHDEWQRRLDELRRWCAEGDIELIEAGEDRERALCSNACLLARALERGGFRSAAMEAVIAAYEKTLALKS